jgi:hypothetical protein
MSWIGKRGNAKVQQYSIDSNGISMFDCGISSQKLLAVQEEQIRLQRIKKC